MLATVRSAAPVIEYEDALTADVAHYYADPLGFVLAMWDWSIAGFLEHHPGPDTWQREALVRIGEQVRARAFDGHTPVAPIRLAVSKGHGVGGSVLLAMIICWIMSTRPHAQGTVTANTITQLQTKTWATLQRWAKLCRTGHWFEINSDRMYRIGFKASWFCAPQSSAEENSESFAGQHAADSTSFYGFDEDSNVPNIIHDVAEGGLTDGEPMIFLLGNPTRSSGRFYEACHGAARDRWQPIIVDSRTSRFTNKAQIEEWAQDYGEDSDFFRVRVRGLPPRASDAQFIDQTRVREAQRRQVVVLPDEPLVAGCDLAWGGEDWNIIRFRRGADARSIPPIRIAGEFTRDPQVLTTRIADVLSREWDGRRVHTLFLDAAGIAGPVAARVRQLGFKNLMEVNFGADSPHEKRRYMRDHMWAELKDWLLIGAIDTSSRLESDLVGPGVRPEKRQRVWLESKEDMKKRGVASPDEADALALTFAMPVQAPVVRHTRGPREQAPTGPMAWAQ